MKKWLYFCLFAAALPGCGPSKQQQIEAALLLGQGNRVLQQFVECGRRLLRHQQRLENVEAEYNASELFTETVFADSPKEVNLFWNLARGVPELVIPAERHCKMLRTALREMQAAGPSGIRGDEERLKEWLLIVEEGDNLSKRLAADILARERALTGIVNLCKQYRAYGPTLKPGPNRPSIWEYNGLTKPRKEVK